MAEPFDLSAEYRRLAAELRARAARNAVSDESVLQLLRVAWPGQTPDLTGSVCDQDGNLGFGAVFFVAWVHAHGLLYPPLPKPFECSADDVIDAMTPEQRRRFLDRLKELWDAAYECVYGPPEEDTSL